MVKGNNANPFPTDHSVVLTRKTALKYFGQEDPMGKIIVADDKENLTVSGVIADFPLNSSQRMDMLLPISFKNNLVPLPGPFTG